MKTRILGAALLALAVASGSAQTLDNTKLDQLLDRLAAKNKGMGALTLARAGNILYSHSFGYRYVNGTQKTPGDASTKYRIGSITKTYTAVMVLQLVEEGRLKLSDTLDRFFPQIPNARKITISHILLHRSGIPNMAADGSARQPKTKEEIVARIAQGQPDFEPGTQSKYSNSAYNLLGQIVEKVGGRTYQDALKERITSKIGLTDTYCPTIGQTDPGKNEAVTYHYIDGWQEGNEMDFSIPGGAGAIVATTSDMTRFIQAVFDLKLLSANSLKLMTTMQDDEGMGMVTFSFAGKTMYGNTGGGGSSGAWLAYDPEGKLALAYATNMKIYPVTNIVSGIYDIYWHRPFEIPNFDPVEVSPEILDRYIGVYSTQGAPVKMTISRRGNTLYIQPPGGSAAPLEAMAENKFKIDPGVFFEFDAAKGTMTIKRPQGERVFTKEKRF